MEGSVSLRLPSFQVPALYRVWPPSHLSRRGAKVSEVTGQLPKEPILNEVRSFPSFLPFFPFSCLHCFSEKTPFDDLPKQSRTGAGILEVAARVIIAKGLISQEQL